MLNQHKLSFQYEWAGNAYINKGILVRPQSLDRPQPQFRSLNLPPDPMPLFNARIENYTMDEAGPAETQIATAAVAGATTIFVQSVTGFALAQRIYVYTDGGGFSLQTINSIDPIGLSFGIAVPLPNSAAVNNIVVATSSDTLG